MSGAPTEPPPSSGIAWRKALTVLLAALLSTFPPVVNWLLRVCVVGAAGDGLALGGCSPEVVLLDALGLAAADALGAASDEADAEELSTESGGAPGPDSVGAVALPSSSKSSRLITTRASRQAEMTTAHSTRWRAAGPDCERSQRRG